VKLDLTKATHKTSEVVQWTCTSQLSKIGLTEEEKQ